MIKKALLSIGLLVCFSLYSKSDVSSHSFLYTRPAHQNIALHQAFWHGSLFDKTKKHAVQAGIYYQKSRQPEDSKKFFLLKDRAIVKVHSTATDRDVLPEWLALPTNFSGNLTLAPEQEQIGGIIEGKRNLGPLFGFDFFKEWWVGLSLPIVRVKNNLKLTQNNVQNAAASTLNVYNITTAFNNPDWNYSKIDGERSRTGLAAARVTLGTTLFSTSRAHAVSYSALSIPTSKKVTNTYLFDSQVGFNGHVGIIWGANLQAPLTREDDNYLVTLNANFENNFLIRNHQYRTFDLKEKEWSRFLLMRKKDQITNATTPGVNVLTHYVRVSPHAVVDFSSSVRCNIKRFEGELGFGLWAHGGDSIKLTTPWVEEYGIAGSTTNTSASASTVKTRASNDATFTLIKETDLDLASASMQPALVYKLHASLGYQGRGEYSNAHFGTGAFIEFPRNTSKALSTWGIWVKGGGAF